MASKQTAIFEKAAECLHAFNACIESAITVTWPQDQLDRFNLWAAHGGIFGIYNSHTSMDWRLRDRPELVEMMLLLLELLQGYLSRISVVRGAVPEALASTEEPSTQRGPASPIIPPAQSTDSSECSIVIAPTEPLDVPSDPVEAVKRDAEDTITKLFRLSAVIRSAGMSYRYQKAENYVQWENGVNLTQKFRDGIKLLFKHKKPPLEEFVSKRLLESICLRQRQIAYSQRHKLVSSTDPTQGVSSAENTPVIPPRSESNYRHKQSVTSSGVRRTVGTSKPSSRKDSADKQGVAPKSAVYTATYVPTTVLKISKLVAAKAVHHALGTIDDSLDTLPPPPATRDMSKEFVCPFCAIPLEKASHQGSLWRSHVLKDIRPYICILPDCKTPYTLYADGVSWVHHMRTVHTITKWKCSNTSHTKPLIFETEAQFTAHTQSTHEKFTREEALELATLSSFQVPRDLEAMPWSECPICMVSLDSSDFMSAYCHIAKELLYFAFHSLPEGPDLEDSQSLQPSHHLSISSDGSMGRRWKSEAETDQAYPWSLWDADNSSETEKDLQVYQSDLRTSLLLPQKDAQQLDQVWKTIRMENSERMKTEPDPSQNLCREYPDDISIHTDPDSGHAITNADKPSSLESRSSQLQAELLKALPRSGDHNLVFHGTGRTPTSDAKTTNYNMMRLLQRADHSKYSLCEFAHDCRPPYAILSHTWGPQEVVFADIAKAPGNWQYKVGYNKIKFCADQARRHGLQFFWVDTCCIDKSDTMELQTAINSMFRWYRDAERCYVYLHDVSNPRASSQPQNVTPWQHAFRTSRWFTRGWTLQELIAPKIVDFYSREGSWLGDKRTLEPLICDITGIPASALRGTHLSDFTIIEREAWARNRQTTHEEDMVYSLLGIFDVYMQLMYGEGREKAQKRLRDEVQKAVKGPRSADFSVPFSLSGVPETEYFVGREREMIEIHRALSTDGSRRIVTLHGLGGIGKTQLAVTYAKRYRDEYSAIFWLDVKDEASLQLSFTKVATQILLTHPHTSRLSGLDLQSNHNEVIEAIKAWLSLPSNNRWLLIYDNYDNPRLPDRTDNHGVDINRFIPISYQGSIIITTRLLQVDIGRRIRIRKLESINDSLVILSKTSGRDSLRDDVHAQRLVRELDGLPLALATAGAYLRRVPTSFDDYLRLYKGSWTKLHTITPSLGSYQNRTLCSTWQLSYSQIQAENPLAADLLRWWAYFNNEDLWFELLQPKDKDGPAWIYELNDELKFHHAIGTLHDYGLIEPHDLTPDFIESKGYSIHPCVHSWTVHVLNQHWDLDLAKLATDCVASRVPSNYDAKFWLLQRRLLPHAINCRDTIRASDHNMAWASHKLGNLFANQGKLQKAEDMYIRALRGKEKALGPDHTSTLDTVNNLGLLYVNQGKLHEAEDMYMRALRGKEKALGPDHTSTLDTVNNLGLLYANQGKLQEAEEMFLRALRGYEKAIGPQHIIAYRPAIDTMWGFGALLWDQGKLVEARTYYQGAHDNLEALLGPHHPEVQTLHNGLLELNQKIQDSTALQQT